MNLVNKLNQFESLEVSKCNSLDFKEIKETKFILSANNLLSILDEIKENYYVVELKGNRILKCTNEYYDTEDFKLYMAYHNGSANRYLIKKNEIEGNKNNSIEIKFHSNKGESNKIKQKFNDNNFENLRTWEFMHENTPFSPETLKKMLKNSFYRIILMHKTSAEKITIDIDMILTNFQLKIKLPYLAIVEVRQAKHASFSNFILILRKLNIQKTSLNKYCIGIALLNKEVKKNKYKSKLLAINKIHNVSYSE